MMSAVLIENSRNRKFRITALWLFTLLMFASLSLLPPIPQPLQFHAFADQRTVWGIPHFADVISNVAFILVALSGWHFLRASGTKNSVHSRLRLLWMIFFGSVGLTGTGSAYYHLAPDSARLVWDRLPMTLVAASLITVIIAERISLTAGMRLLVPLLLTGIFSVLYWQQTDDLRLYGFVQFFPLVLAPLIFALFPSRQRESKFLMLMIVSYALAKLCEASDQIVFDSLHFLSGHTLKHLLAAVALFQMLQMLKSRRE